MATTRVQAMRRGWRKMAGICAIAWLCAACEPSRKQLIADHEATLERYCLDCHNQAERAGELALEPVRLESVAADPEKWERVIRKLRAGMMPPVDQPRPERDTYVELASFIEGELDQPATVGLPPPGLHRLNRAEYGNAI